MRFDSLDEWLDWQLTLHSTAIDLGLARVGEVAERLNINRIAKRVITVAGTNGKGSTVASYENWLQRAGFSVASFTSPHLLRYNERIKFDLQMASDADICAAFEAIDQARAEIALTYFEFGTLAALWLIHRRQPDFAILEVGLGGRLDAVNIIDADMVHLTSIGLDHQNWLGDTRELIGFEKAGVLRDGIPVICNDIDPPKSVLDEIHRHHCKAHFYQVDFFMQPDAQPNLYEWHNATLSLTIMPVLPGTHQVQNLAGVLAGLHELLDLTQYTSENIRQNFVGTELVGRFQKLPSELDAEVYIDVGHNADAARILAQNLALLRKPGGRIIVVLGMLNDKDNAAFVAELDKVVDSWWLLNLQTERGLGARELGERLDGQLSPEKYFESAAEVLDHSLLSLHNRDIMLVTGSFVTVEHFLMALSSQG